MVRPSSLADSALLRPASPTAQQHLVEHAADPLVVEGGVDRGVDGPLVRLVGRGPGGAVAGFAHRLLGVRVEPVAQRRVVGPGADDGLPQQVAEARSRAAVRARAAGRGRAPRRRGPRPARRSAPGRPRPAWCRGWTRRSSRAGARPAGSPSRRGRRRGRPRRPTGRRRPR